MNTFSHWRAVGRAMQEARRQDGVAVDVTTEDGVVLTRWRRQEPYVVVSLDRNIGDDLVDATVTADGYDIQLYAPTAAEALRVLAALGLIDNDIAYAADERYGRCQVAGCKRLAQWWPAEAASPARWVHVHKGDDRFVDYPNHNVVVGG